MDKNLLTLRVNSTNLGYFTKFKGHIPKVLEVIWLVIELGLDVMAIHFLSKFNEYRMTIV